GTAFPPAPWFQWQRQCSVCSRPHNPKLRSSSQAPFGGWQYHFFRVPLHRHFDGLGKGLENGLDLVVFVPSLCLDVQVGLGPVTEGLEEVEEHLGGHL